MAPHIALTALICLHSIPFRQHNSMGPNPVDVHAFPALQTWIDSGPPQPAKQRYLIVSTYFLLFRLAARINRYFLYMNSLSRSFSVTDSIQSSQKSLADIFGHKYEPKKVISKFEALDDDSIYLIIVALCYTDVTQKLKQIWPLSLTCKRLRGVCLSLMFKRVLWPNKHMRNDDDDVPMLPETLWPYIQLGL